MNFEELLEKVMDENMSMEEVESNPLYDCVLCINDLSYWDDPNEILFDINYLENQLKKLNITIDPYDSWDELYEQLVEKINNLPDFVVSNFLNKEN